MIELNEKEKLCFTFPSRTRDYFEEVAKQFERFNFHFELLDLKEFSEKEKLFLKYFSTINLSINEKNTLSILDLIDLSDFRRLDPEKTVWMNDSILNYYFE